MSERSSRIESVDYLRGIAALSVLWFHLTNGDPSFLPDSTLKATGTYAYAGVAAFFVISGFIIPFTLDSPTYSIPRDGVRFFARRLVRLEPPYLASVLLTAVIFYPDPLLSWVRGEPPGELLATLALHPLYLVPWFGGEWVNPVYWTLAIEFQYYVAMIFCAPVLFTRAWPIQRLFLLGCLILSVEITDERIFTCYLSLFGLGFLHFLRLRRGMNTAELILWSAAFACSTYDAIGTANAVVGLAALAALSVPWPRTKVLSFLGAISYSLYLIHEPVSSRVMDISSHFPKEQWIVFLFLAVAVLLSVLIADFFWWAIERPSIALSKRIANRDRASPSQAW